MAKPIQFLKKAIIHFVGSKNNLDPVRLSERELKLSDDETELLDESFLHRFRNNTEYYAFSHPDDLKFNEVFQFCSDIFNGASFTSRSASIAKHLYEQSTHPKVKGGELYVGLFEGLPVESRVHNAIGIFKTENKSTFLDAHQTDGSIDLSFREGVELSKIDKGCLVINHNIDKGYDVLIFDNQNRGEEAQYWKEKFLGILPQQNEYHHTSQLLSLTRQFITGPLESEMNLAKNERVELLHKSLNYFKSHESFNIEAFQNEVFEKEEMIDSFRRFGSQYVMNADYDIAANFEISADAVKKQSRVFKSVLKLDRNFHIYIHGRTDLIEKGTDTNGRKYYKIYYEEEA